MSDPEIIKRSFATVTALLGDVREQLRKVCNLWVSTAADDEQREVVRRMVDYELCKQDETLGNVIRALGMDGVFDAPSTGDEKADFIKTGQMCKSFLVHRGVGAIVTIVQGSFCMSFQTTPANVDLLLEHGEGGALAFNQDSIDRVQNTLRFLDGMLRLQRESVARLEAMYEASEEALGKIGMAAVPIRSGQNKGQPN